jgi:23S rRNA pseudouridine955/2504/2580 synthase
VTRFSPRQRLGAYTLVLVECSTGQRHQVRAHLAHAGFPVAGDGDYGGPPLPGAGGPFLHASRLRLPDGRGDFDAPLPPARQEVLQRLAGA